MTDEPEPNLQNLWQDQPTEISPMLLADVHQRALKFDARLKRGMFLRYSETVVALALVGFELFIIRDGLIRIGLFLIAIGAMFSLHVSRGFSAKTRNSGAASASQACFEFYKEVLKVRIRYTQTAWAWMILPLLPGVLLVEYCIHQGLGQLYPHARISHEMASRWTYGTDIFLVFFLGAYIAYWHLRARKLRRELAELG